MDVITIGPGIRQSFSNFYLKYDCSLERKIVSLSNSKLYLFMGYILQLRGTENVK